jgi:dephospho-CoA kinase
MNLHDSKRTFRIFGLTGNIGSGKSKAASIFENLGVSIIDADLLARKAVEPGGATLQSIATAFGDTVITDTGELNRKAMGEIIFKNPTERRKLEQIVHPEIRRLYFAALKELTPKLNTGDIVLYVVPLLFESQFDYEELDGVIVVYAPKETCLKRIVQRDKCSLEYAASKYASQIDIEEKRVKADFVIDNSGSLEALEKGVAELYSTLVGKE